MEDLRNAKEPPNCGTTGTGIYRPLYSATLEETLGDQDHYRQRLSGGAEIDLAIERNEVVCWSPLIATYFGREPYRRWQKSGFTRVVLQFGTKRDPRLKDVPTLTELMQQYKTPDSGKRLAKVILTAVTLAARSRPRPACPRTAQKFFAKPTQSDQRPGAPSGSRETRLERESGNGRRA